MLQRGLIVKMSNIESKILEYVISGLNSLERDNCKSVNMLARNKEDANYLKKYLTNYNVEITESMGGSWYNLKISKKEKKQNA